MKNLTSIIAGGIAALSFATASFAIDMPHRKPGLWETTMNSPAMKGRNVVAQQCIDEKTDADMLKQTMAGKDNSCTQTASHAISGGWEFSATCKQADSTTTSHGTLTGDFNSQYTMQVQGHRTPPMNGVSDFQTNISARYMGACTADMKPGDMKINGMLLHAGGMPANLTPQQTAQMKQMMEQMKKQMQQQKQQQ
ncbi:MAG: hypothetical protein JWM03_100 [Rhodocyclales bacterium]|nr:hypothetical protein [Rhodocyclales bacterium]